MVSRRSVTRRCNPGPIWKGSPVTTAYLPVGVADVMVVVVATGNCAATAVTNDRRCRGCQR